MAKLPDAMAEQPEQVQLEPEHHKIDLVIVSEREEREEKDSGYEDFDALDDDCEDLDSDMDGSIIHRPRPKKAVKPPAVPQRSDKRASRILESVLLELKTLDGTLPAKDAEQLSIVSDPHELYLSSEEDASLSDYDDSNSLIDFAPTEDGASQPTSRASSRRSQEDTARVVSFTLVTKPQIIQIIIPPPASQIQKRHSTSLDTLTSTTTTHSTTSYIPSNTRRPPPLMLHSTSPPSRSLTQRSGASLTSLPKRKPSKLNLSTLVSSAKNSFLASDPFALPSTQSYDDEEEAETPVTPKTPTSMAAAAFKKGLSRSMSKRKPSMPKLSKAYDVAGQRESLRMTREAPLEEGGEANERRTVHRAETMPTAAEGVRYSDITQAAGEVIRAPPNEGRDRKTSMGHKMSLGMGMGLGRKKSVKGRGERYMG